MIHTVELTASRYQDWSIEPQSRLVFEDSNEKAQANPLLDDALCRLLRLARSSASPADMEALGVLLNHMDSLEQASKTAVNKPKAGQQGVVLQGTVTLTL